jgi:hypothetical protein
LFTVRYFCIFASQSCAVFARSHLRERNILCQDHVGFGHRCFIGGIECGSMRARGWNFKPQEALLDKTFKLPDIDKVK